MLRKQKMFVFLIPPFVANDISEVPLFCTRKNDLTELRKCRYFAIEIMS